MRKVSFGRRVTGILLAAGASTRMGRVKQLLPVAGIPLVEKTLRAALESRLDYLLLVLGHRAGEIVKALGDISRNSRLKIVHNPNYRKGISSSLVAGVKKIPHDHDHAMVLLADMPFVDKSAIDQLLNAYLKSKSPIGAVKVDKRAAHPVVFRRDLFPELKTLTGDVGARGLLKKYGGQICFVTPQTNYDHRDIDTMEDYRKFQMDSKERKKQWPIS